MRFRWSARFMAGVAAAALVPLTITATAATPDISGPWQIVHAPRALRTLDGKAPPLLAAAKATYESHRQLHAKGDNSYDSMQRCVPPGVPRLQAQANFPWSIVQGTRHYVFIFEWNHLNRDVYMSEGHFEGIGPTYLGQSVGHWEGQTLVVDTDSYNDATLLDDSGLPHSDELQTLERYRLIQGGKGLELQIRFTDPKTFSKPWTAKLEFGKQPNAILKEDYCLRRLGLVK